MFRRIRETLNAWTVRALQHEIIEAARDGARATQHLLAVIFHAMLTILLLPFVAKLWLIDHVVYWVREVKSRREFRRVEAARYAAWCDQREQEMRAG